MQGARQESLSTLVGYLGQEGFKSFRYVAGGSNAVAREHILRVVFTGIVGEPDPLLIVLPDECLHRQIDCQRSALGHRGRARFGVAEYDDRPRAHVQPGLFGNGGMIDPAKNDPASSRLRLDRSLKIIDCFLNRVPAWFRDKSIVRGRGNGRYRERNRRHDQKRVVMFVNHCGEMSTSPASNDLSRPVTTNSPIAIKNSPSVCLSALLVADMPPRQRNRSS